MKNGLFIIAFLASTACNQLIGERGNDERVTKTYSVDSFDEIDIRGAFEITLSPSISREVILEVDENLVKYIDISVLGSRLIIDTDRRLDSRKGVKIEIPVNNLRKISSSGASDIISSEPISSSDLVVEVSGAGKIDLKLDVKSIELDLSGATLVYLEGIAERLDVDMSGAGSLEAEGFQVQDCYIDISGVGSALVNVTGTLDAQLSGLGKVEYLGDPESVKGDVSGVGKVSKAND